MTDAGLGWKDRLSESTIQPMRAGRISPGSYRVVSFHHPCLKQCRRMKPQAVKFMLMAQDMDRAVAFYRDTMGFVEGFVSPHWSELRLGDAILALHGGGDGLRTKTGLSLQFENVSEAYAEALAAGAMGVQPPAAREGEPIILASLADPEGNEIMLTQYVDEH